MRTAHLLLALAVTLTAVPAFAFNALGHKVIAEIAWQRLTPEQRGEIVKTLRRHPRFDEDFAKRIDETGDEDHLIFLHAATWPDIARGIRGPDRAKYDMGPWHYVNVPLLIDGTKPPASLNLAMGQPTGPAKQWNVAQATHYALATIHGDGSPQAKALAYCWLFHLVGDMHQPMHSTALFCERFPGGDRGGNSIPLRQSGNLHALWDNLLGRSHKLNNVRREVFDLTQNADAWEVDTQSDIAEWIEESHKLAESFAYSPEIIAAVQAPGDLEPIVLPPTYLKSAGRLAGERVIAAGVRLAALLDAKGKPEEGAPDEDPFAAPVIRTPPTPPAVKSVEATTGIWLNTNGDVRHNSTCTW